MSKIKVTIEQNGNIIEVDGDILLLNIANVDGIKLATKQVILGPKTTDLSDLLRIYANLGARLHSDVIDSIYENDVSIQEQIEYLVPTIKFTKGESVSDEDK